MFRFFLEQCEVISLRRAKRQDRVHSMTIKKSFSAFITIAFYIGPMASGALHL